MLRLEINLLRNAINRAKAVRPRVTWLGGRSFQVTGSTGGQYLVEFSVANGVKLGQCNCKAGQTGSPCFHLAAAAALNIAIQSMRQAGESAEIGV